MRADLSQHQITHTLQINWFSGSAVTNYLWRQTASLSWLDDSRAKPLSKLHPTLDIVLFRHSTKYSLNSNKPGGGGVRLGKFRFRGLLWTASNEALVLSGAQRETSDLSGLRWRWCCASVHAPGPAPWPWWWGPCLGWYETEPPGPTEDLWRTWMGGNWSVQ